MSILSELSDALAKELVPTRKNAYDTLIKKLCQDYFKNEVMYNISEEDSEEAEMIEASLLEIKKTIKHLIAAYVLNFSVILTNEKCIYTCDIASIEINYTKEKDRTKIDSIVIHRAINI
jgi:hypothetical protein